MTIPGNKILCKDVTTVPIRQTAVCAHAHTQRKSLTVLKEKSPKKIIFIPNFQNTIIGFVPIMNLVAI